jgi:hypothetical protein
MHVFRTNPASVHYRTPLVVRASLPRTFWTLGAFVEFALISCGVYLLAEACLKPLEADQFSVISGGVFLALASVLLYYLIRPQSKQVLARPEARCTSPIPPAQLPAAAYGKALPVPRAGHTLQRNPDLPAPL